MIRGAGHDGRDGRHVTGRAADLHFTDHNAGLHGTDDDAGLHVTRRAAELYLSNPATVQHDSTVQHDTAAVLHDAADPAEYHVSDDSRLASDVAARHDRAWSGWHQRNDIGIRLPFVRWPSGHVEGSAEPAGGNSRHVPERSVELGRSLRILAGDAHAADHLHSSGSGGLRRGPVMFARARSEKNPRKAVQGWASGPALLVSARVAEQHQRRHRIDSRTGDGQRPVEVRTGHPSCRADETDDLPRLHGRSFLDVDP